MPNSLYGGIQGARSNPNAIKNQECAFDPCKKLVGNSGAKGYCPGHYQQIRTGRKLAPLQVRRLHDYAPSGYKTCRHCFAILPIANFFKYSKGKDGLSRHCRECESFYKKLRVFGLTKEQFLIKLQSQNFRCLICNKDISTSAVIDHDHTTNKIRALLCSLCNTGLGCFKDNQEFLVNAVWYLKEYSNA